MSDQEPVGVVTAQQRVGLFRRQRIVFFIRADHPAVPDRPGRTVQEFERRVLPALLRGPVKPFAHPGVERIHFQIAFEQSGAQSRVYEEVAADAQHRVAGREPAAEFRVGREQLAVILHAELPRRFEVLPARVAHVAGQHHSFVIAQQQHGGASRVGGLLFEFVHQPQQRQHVVAAVENVADHRQLVVSVAPPAVAVDHAVGLEERRKTPEIAVKVGRDEQFRGLREFPGTSLDDVRRDAEEVCAPARTDLDRAASVGHHADAPPLVGGRCIGALFRVVDDIGSVGRVFPAEVVFRRFRLCCGVRRREGAERCGQKRSEQQGQAFHLPVRFGGVIRSPS